MISIKGFPTPNACRQEEGPASPSFAAISLTSGVTFMPKHSRPDMDDTDDTPTVLTMSPANYLRYIMASLTPWSRPHVDEDNILVGTEAGGDPKAHYVAEVETECLNVADAKEMEDYKFYTNEDALPKYFRLLENGEFLKDWNAGEIGGLPDFYEMTGDSLTTLIDDLTTLIDDTEGREMSDREAFVAVRLMTTRAMVEFMVAWATVDFIKQTVETSDPENFERALQAANWMCKNERELIANSIGMKDIVFETETEGDEVVLRARQVFEDGEEKGITVEGLLTKIADDLARPLDGWMERANDVTDESIFEESTGVVASSLEWDVNSYTRLIEIMRHWDGYFSDTSQSQTEERQDMNGTTEQQGTPLQEARKNIKRNSPENPLPKATLAAILNEIVAGSSEEGMSNTVETPQNGSVSEDNVSTAQAGMETAQATDFIGCSVPLDEQGNPDWANAVLHGSDTSTAAETDYDTEDLLLGLFEDTLVNRLRLDNFVNELSIPSDYKAEYIKDVLKDLLQAENPEDMNGNNFEALQEMIACMIEPIDDDETSEEAEDGPLNHILSALAGAMHQLDREESDPLAH